MNLSSFAATEPAWFLGGLHDGPYETLAIAFLLFIFFVALILKTVGSPWRLRLARVTVGGQARRPMQPSSLTTLFDGGHLQGLVARCRWELDIFKAYLAETLGNKTGSGLHVAPSRHLPVTSTVTTSKPTNERRRWVRHPSNMQAFCQILNDRNERRWRVRVRDISAGGVGLVSPCPVPLGSILLIQFHLPESFPRTLVKAEVMFLSRTGTNEWALGCEFLEPLGEPDYQSHL